MVPPRLRIWGQEFRCRGIRGLRIDVCPQTGAEDPVLVVLRLTVFGKKQIGKYAKPIRFRIRQTGRAAK